MNRKGAIETVLSRLYGGFELRDGRKISFVRSGQSDEGYSHRVTIQRGSESTERGGSLDWDSKGSWWTHSCSSARNLTLDLRETPKEYNNDGQAVVIVNNEILFLVVKKVSEGVDYKLPHEVDNLVFNKGEGKDIEVTEIVPIQEIVSMWGRTGGGWKFELYQHRPPNGSPTLPDHWVGLLHRSDGAVTIIKKGNEFPF